MSAVIQRHAIELLWRHWTAAGVAGTAKPPQHAIDLEAMIAFTPYLAAADPRLGDESRDWCAGVGKGFISISRLRQIIRLMPARSQSTAMDLPTALVSGLDIAGERSNKSRAPSLDLPCLVQLRSRYIFGVGARADVLSRLVMRDGTEPRSAAALNPVGYTKQAIANVLAELSQAGVLKKFVRARSASYELAKEAPLRSLLAPLPSGMPPWPERFAIVATVLETWRQFGARATYSIELAKALDQMRPLLAQAGELVSVSGKPSQVLRHIERWVISLLDDDVWEDSWMFGGQDITHEILQALDQSLVKAVHSGKRPAGHIELGGPTFRNADRNRGSTELVVRFSAEHPKQELTIQGHVEGTLRFDPSSKNKQALLRSLKISDVSVHFDDD